MARRNQRPITEITPKKLDKLIDSKKVFTAKEAGDILSSFCTKTPLKPKEVLSGYQKDGYRGILKEARKRHLSQVSAKGPSSGDPVVGKTVISDTVEMVRMAGGANTLVTALEKLLEYLPGRGGRTPRAGEQWNRRIKKQLTVGGKISSKLGALDLTVLEGVEDAEEVRVHYESDHIKIVLV